MQPSAVSRGMWRLIGSAAFSRIRAVHRERLPPSGPVLYVSTHRNGALDTAVFFRFTPRALGLVSVQLQRSRLGRLLFPGIAVARGKDQARGMRADNAAALEASVAHLAAGGEMVVFPEGTSDLGPHHLPFHTGAARIVQAALERGIPLAIVPLALHYEAPAEWQSRVELLVGVPFEPGSQNGVALPQLHDKLTRALESVGVNLPDTTTYARVARLARYATMGSSRSFASALKCFERRALPSLIHAEAGLQTEVGRIRPQLHQGIPLVPTEGRMPAAFLYWFFATPPIAAAALCNLPVIAVANWTSRTLPDAANVVSFWRVLVGVPAALVWAACVGVALGATGYLLWWPAYLAVSWFAVHAYYRWRAAGVSLRNAIHHPSLRTRVLEFRRRVVDEYEAWSDDVARPAA